LGCAFFLPPNYFPAKKKSQTFFKLRKSSEISEFKSEISPGKNLKFLAVKNREKKIKKKK